MAKTQVKWIKNEITPNLIKFPPKMHAALGTFMEYESGNVQDYMRANAPWTDRTGNARQGLFAKHEASLTSHKIVCYHTMPYGIWLEVAHDGQYRIIVPTIQSEGKRVMNGIRKLMAALG